MTELGLRKLIQTLTAESGIAAWAREHELSPGHICDILSYRREPGPKVLDALGLERRISYVQKGNGR
jgi:hypothetical protein